MKLPNGTTINSEPFDWTPEEPKTKQDIDRSLVLLTHGGSSLYKGVEHQAGNITVIEKDGVIKKKRKANKSDENDIQKQFIIWLRKTYKGIKFRTDWFAGHYCPAYVKEQYISAQSGPSFPDILILHPTTHYSGLLIETKKDADEVFLKDMTTLVAKDHIHAQYNEIVELRALGYCAGFGLGLDHMKRLTERYMSGACIKYSPVIIKPLNESQSVQNANKSADEFFGIQGI